MVLLLTAVHQYALFMAIAITIGLGSGSLAISLLDMVVRLLGAEMVNSGFGYMLLFMALGQGIGGPLAGMGDISILHEPLRPCSIGYKTYYHQMHHSL